MKLYEFYQYINKYSCLADKDFLVDFYNEILSDGDKNPFDGKSEDYRERLYRGQDPIVQKNAKKILNVNYTLFTDFLDNCMDEDNYPIISNDINKTFNIKSNPTLESISSELYRILIGLTNSIISTETKTPKIKRKRESLENIKVEGDNIYENGRVIAKVPNITLNESELPHELPYIEQLLLAYADAEELDEIGLDDLPSLDPLYQEDFCEQKLNFYKAQYMYRVLGEIEKNSSKDIKKLKEEILDAVKPISRLHYDNAFIKMTQVTTESTRTNLSSSLISRNTDLLGNKEKKGVCHDLVNDNELWWVEKDE